MGGMWTGNGSQQAEGWEENVKVDWIQLVISFFRVLHQIFFG